ncbi:hypothetical protein GW17_00049324 [Ensete ventricosum]|nr:hypothetical protein GW17_00049324 [Ensete ventricosum]
MDVPDGDDWVRDTPFGEGVFVSKVLVSCSMKLLLLPLLQLDVQRCLHKQLEVHFMMLLLLVIRLKSSC